MGFSLRQIVRKVGGKLLGETPLARAPLPSSAEIDSHEREFLAQIAEIEAMESGSFEGRGSGIITCAADRFVPFLEVGLSSLRRHGCTLPVEVWHMEDEISEANSARLARFGAVTRESRETFWLAHSGRHYAHGFKPHALVKCSFQHVMFLDADNIPLKDPSFILDSPEYREFGGVLWRDRDHRLSDFHGRTFATMNTLRTRFDLATIPFAHESGQMAFDKKRCWRGLKLAEYVNSRPAFFYPFLYGDKNTYGFCFDALKLPYYTLPYPPDFVRSRKFDSLLLQKWNDGEPLFAHLAGGERKFWRTERNLNGLRQWLSHPRSHG